MRDPSESPGHTPDKRMAATMIRIVSVMLADQYHLAAKLSIPGAVLREFPGFPILPLGIDRFCDSELQQGPPDDE
jgi:hypothetical protein